MGVKAIPDGYYSLTPYLVIKGAAEAIEFYKKVFGAIETMRMPGPGGRDHARRGQDRQFGADAGGRKSGARLPVAEEPWRRHGRSVMFYTDDVDATFKKAVDAGAKTDQPPTDMFWGDRMANITDPFGHNWAIATHTEDVSPEEMEKRA